MALFKNLIKGKNESVLDFDRYRAVFMTFTAVDMYEWVWRGGSNVCT